MNVLRRGIPLSVFLLTPELVTGDTVRCLKDPIPVSLLVLSTGPRLNGAFSVVKEEGGDLIDLFVAVVVVVLVVKGDCGPLVAGVEVSFTELVSALYFKRGLSFFEVACPELVILSLGTLGAVSASPP